MKTPLTLTAQSALAAALRTLADGWENDAKCLAPGSRARRDIEQDVALLRHEAGHVDDGHALADNLVVFAGTRPEDRAGFPQDHALNSALFVTDDLIMPSAGAQKAISAYLADGRARGDLPPTKGALVRRYAKALGLPVQTLHAIADENEEG